MSEEDSTRSVQGKSEAGKQEKEDKKDENAWAERQVHIKVPKNHHAEGFMQNGTTGKSKGTGC
jgi:hypothetical protein